MVAADRIGGTQSTGSFECTLLSERSQVRMDREEEAEGSGSMEICFVDDEVSISSTKVSM